MPNADKSNSSRNNSKAWKKFRKQFNPQKRRLTRVKVAQD
jgi:hypothetical protein